MIETLSHIAAITLRDAIEEAISRLEAEIKRPEPQGLRPDAASYFLALHKDQLASIGELKKIRGVAHKRVFDTSSTAEMHMASKSSAVTP